VVLDYLERFPEGIGRLFDGSNQGKLVIRIPE
jgi:NADPH-dependent curcumin reductase CurA